MDVVSVIVGSICMGNSEMLGTKLEDFFFSIPSAKNVYRRQPEGNRSERKIDAE